VGTRSHRLPQFTLAVGRATGAVTLTQPDGRTLPLDRAFLWGADSRWPRRTVKGWTIWLPKLPPDSTHALGRRKRRGRTPAFPGQLQPGPGARAIDRGRAPLLVRADARSTWATIHLGEGPPALCSRRASHFEWASEFRWIGQGPYAGIPTRIGSRIRPSYMNRISISGTGVAWMCRGFLLDGRASYFARPATSRRAVDGGLCSATTLCLRRANKGVRPELPLTRPDRAHRGSSPLSLLRNARNRCWAVNRQPGGPQWGAGSDTEFLERLSKSKHTNALRVQTTAVNISPGLFAPRSTGVSEWKRLHSLTLVATNQPSRARIEYHARSH